MSSCGNVPFIGALARPGRLTGTLVVRNDAKSCRSSRDES